MDIATGQIAKKLRELARAVDEDKYGTDTDFDQAAFLTDMETGIVAPLGGEIYTDE